MINSSVFCMLQMATSSADAAAASAAPIIADPRAGEQLSTPPPLPNFPSPTGTSPVSGQGEARCCTLIPIAVAGNLSCLFWKVWGPVKTRTSLWGKCVVVGLGGVCLQVPLAIFFAKREPVGELSQTCWHSEVDKAQAPFSKCAHLHTPIKNRPSGMDSDGRR